MSGDEACKVNNECLCIISFFDKKDILCILSHSTKAKSTHLLKKIISNMIH